MFRSGKPAFYLRGKPVQAKSFLKQALLNGYLEDEP